LKSPIRRSNLIARVAPGVFALVIFDAGDYCLSSLQRRIVNRLWKLHSQKSDILSLNFSVQASSWISASSFSFTELLAVQLSRLKSPFRPERLLLLTILRLLRLSGTSHEFSLAPRNFFRQFFLEFAPSGAGTAFFRRRAHPLRIASCRHRHTRNGDYRQIPI
jgi:hypothetical protein